MSTTGDLTHLDPICDRDDDPPIEAPGTVADAIEALEEAHQRLEQYPDDLVAALLNLMDSAADEVARHERERYAAHLDRTARNGRDLAENVRSGLRLAATHLRRDLARFRPGDPR